MKMVTFPGLGLEFDLNPVLLSIGDKFSIHWYGAIIAIGFLLAVIFCCRQSDRFGLKNDDIYDVLLLAVPLAIVGARLYYVIFEFENYYVEGSIGKTLGNIVRIWDGGLAIYGGLIVALLTGFIVTRVKKISFLALADLASMGFLIGQSVGRWGNFVNVEAFGGVTDVAWRMAGPDVAGYLSRTGQIDAAVKAQIIDGTLGVHPTFLYESLWNAVGLLLLVFVVRRFRRFDGELFFSYLIWYGIGRFIIEGLRTDSLYIPGTALRVSQLVALASVLIGVICILVMLFVLKKTPEQLYVNRMKEAESDVGEGA